MRCTMNKRFLILIFTMMVMMLFSGCNDNDSPVSDNTGGPETYYEYGFMEECSNGTKYIKIESFDVSDNHSSAAVSDAVHYYVVLKINTNLSNDDFSNDDNLLELWLSPQERLVLNFISWDVDTKKLVYEIPQNESLDYSELLNLEISNSEEQYPFLYLLFNVFDNYCVVDNTQYCGQGILLRLNH